MRRFFEAAGTGDQKRLAWLLSGRAGGPKYGTMESTDPRGASPVFVVASGAGGAGAYSTAAAAEATAAAPKVPSSAHNLTAVSSSAPASKK